MMTERERKNTKRVTMLMNMSDAQYKPIKRRIDLGEIDKINSMQLFIIFIFINRYEHTKAEYKPKLLQPIKYLLPL